MKNYIGKILWSNWIPFVSNLVLFPLVGVICIWLKIIFPNSIFNFIIFSLFFNIIYLTIAVLTDIIFFDILLKKINKEKIYLKLSIDWLIILLGFLLVIREIDAIIILFTIVLLLSLIIRSKKLIEIVQK